MRLRFHGTGAAFNPAFGSNGAFFAHGEDLYLIDCGESAFARLHAADLFSLYPGQITVLLTHKHADHCGSLGTLCLYAAAKLRRTITVVHPDERVRTLLSICGAREDQYRLIPALDERGVRATPVPVRHVPSIPAFAFYLEAGGETVYYSGDAGELPDEVVLGVREGRIARAYQDAAYFDGTPPPNPVHAPLPALTAQISPAIRGRFTLMHMNRDYRAEARALGFDVAERDPLFQ